MEVVKVEEYGIEEVEEMVRSEGVVESIDRGCREGIGVM